MSGRILVVDDTATNRLILRAKLSADYYDVLQADGGISGLEMARRELPDLVLLDVMMPDMDGFAVCLALKSDPLTAHIPVVMVTAANAQEDRIRGLEAGADDFLNKPINDITLFARVRNLMRVKMMFDELKMREFTTQELGLGDMTGSLEAKLDHTASVVLALKSREQSDRFRACIDAQFAYQTRCARHESEVLALGAEDPPDAFIITQHLADGDDGLRLVSKLRANPATRQCAILLVVEDGSLETASKALDVGASDYIFAPFDPNEMAARLRSQMRRKKYSDQLRSNVRDSLRLAVTDPLTGLYNRRYATQHIARIVARATETGMPYAVMMLDLDRFKSVNDTFGHAGGDAVLVEFANRLKANLRGIDLIARMGGEEFLVVMPDTSPHEASHSAERIRRVIHETPFLLDNGELTPVTVSIGVASESCSARTADDVIQQADQALYESKTSGRNKVTFHANAA